MCDITRTSAPEICGSVLIRLMRAAPRGVAANRRSRTIRRRTPFQDGLECLYGFGVGEGQELAVFAFLGEACAQTRHQIGRGNHHRCGHQLSLAWASDLASGASALQSAAR